MTTIIGIIACGIALWAAVRHIPRMHRLEEAVTRQEEHLLHLSLYLRWVEENALELASDLHDMEDILAEDYPELIDPPKPDYPAAYDKWGEFDA